MPLDRDSQATLNTKGSHYGSNKCLGGEKIHMRLCSEPNKSVDDIYERLKCKKMPFRKIKI